MSAQIKAKSAKEDALGNAELFHSKKMGAVDGKQTFGVMSGAYIQKLGFYLDKSSNLLGLGVKFDNGAQCLIGGCNSSKANSSVDLTSDSIAKIYVQTASGGIKSIYIETLKGVTYNSSTGKDPMDAPYDWAMLIDSVSSDPLSNVVLVGLYGSADTQIENISFVYKKDVLTNHGMSGVAYKNLTTSSPEFLNVATAAVSNTTDQPQQMSVTFAESVSSSYNFSTTAGVSAGLTTSVDAGIPFVAEGKVEVSATVSLDVTLGVSTSTSKDFSYNAIVTVGANETLQANATACSYTISGDYTAKYSEVWVHAGAVTRSVSGKINGVSAYDVNVSYVSMA